MYFFFFFLCYNVINMFVLAGDEILSVNGEELAGLSHAEAIQVFKRVRNGQIRLKVARRKNQNQNQNEK